MSKYKLTYFDLRGIGEPIRWIFLVSNISFEDERISVELWPQLKQKVDWGQLPVLEIDGKVKITQSATICRFLAKEFDLSPPEKLEAVKCEEMVDAINDIRILWRNFFIENKYGDSSKAKEMKGLLEKDDFPRFLKMFEQVVKQSGGQFILGNKVYWADFWLANFLEIWEESMGPTFLDHYPCLKIQRAAVFSIPQIAKWVKLRPQTFV